MPSLLSAEELASEIENYLFANDLDRKEYVDDLVVRRGMPHRLARQDRETIWAIRDRVAAWMDGRKLFSRNYSRIKILGSSPQPDLPDPMRSRILPTSSSTKCRI